MATNYNSLITSEKNLKKMVMEFLEYSFATHEKLWKYIFNQEDGHKIIDSIESRVKEAEQKERDLVDECIWTISKDDPRANHLRFVISIIYSAKDIAIATNYSLTIAKTFVRKQINQNHIIMIEDLSKNYLDLLQKYMKIYKDKKIRDIFDQTEKMYSDFIELSHEVMKAIKLQLANEDNELDYFPISQIVKSMEITIERIKSIFANAVSKEIS